MDRKLHAVTTSESSFCVCPKIPMAFLFFSCLDFFLVVVSVLISSQVCLVFSIAYMPLSHRAILVGGGKSILVDIFHILFWLRI